MDMVEQDAINYYNLFKVPTQHGDMASLPIMHNVAKDKEWMVASMPLYDKVIGRGLMEESKFIEIAREYKSRDMLPSEIEWLVEMKFMNMECPPSIVIGSSKVVELLKSQEHLHFQAIHFQSMPPLGATSSDQDEIKAFPTKLPKCTIGGATLKGSYSLHATDSYYGEDGTTWTKQMDAMATCLTSPPFTHSGNMRPLGPTTIDAIKQSMDELAGYAFNHRGKEPSIEHAMDANLIGHFLAFRLKRNNNPSTLIKVLHHFKYVVTFITECPCPGTKTWSMAHSSLLHTWMRNVTAKLRQDVGAWQERHKDKKARLDVEMPPVWDHVEAKFDEACTEYEVSGCVSWCVMVLCGRRVAKVRICNKCKCNTHPHKPFHMHAGQ